MTEIHSFLLNAGYQPQTKTGDLVYGAIAKAFDLMGESCSGLLLNHLSTVYSIPRHIVLTRFDLISRAIGQVFGYGSEVFLHEIRENLLKSLHGITAADYVVPTADLVKKAYREETLQSVRSFGSEQAAVLLFSGFSGRQQIINSFYQYPLNEKVAGAGAGATRNPKYDSNSDDDKQYQHPHIAPPGAHLDFPLCPHPREKGNKGAHLDSPYLCVYGVRQAIDNFQKVVLPHTHVVTDDPFMVYARQVLQEHRQGQRHDHYHISKWAEGHHA